MGTELADRVREALGDGQVREVRMFGGLAFMVDERLVLSAGPDGDLLVRTDPARVEEMLARPGAQIAEMGGRSMGSGWIAVGADAVATADGLRTWVDTALDYLRDGAPPPSRRRRR